MKKVVIICVSLTVIAAAVVMGIFMFGDYNQPKTDVGNRNTIKPSYGSIAETIEATGMVKPNAEYSITSQIPAKVIECAIQEGDTVTEGSILYRLDDSAVQRQIAQSRVTLEKAQTALKQSQNAQGDLSVRANSGGTIVKKYVNNGDMVAPGAKIADIVDNSRMLLKVPFNEGDKSHVAVGSQATVVISANGAVCNGEVAKVYSGTNTYGGNRVGFLAEIIVTNPGGINKGDKAMAIIGAVATLADGEFENFTETTATASTAGQIISVGKDEGSFVSNGEIIAAIKNDTIKNTIENGEIQIKEIQTTINNLASQLADYVITSPTSGTVTTLTVKKGEMGQGPLAVITDNSGLYIDAEIDEASIQKVQVGQRVEINPVSGGDKTFGRVVTIDTHGILKNGDTFYSVKIKADDDSTLMSGMNMELYITVSQKDNVLMLPKGAVSANTVKVVTEGGIVPKTIKTGIKNNDFIEILSGITENDRVILEGEKL